MPELPEVETVKKSLEGLITGLVITEVRLFMPKIVKTPSPTLFSDTLAGKTIKRLGRRGKYLLFHLSDKHTLVIHFRMTGRLVYSPPQTEPAKHTHAVFRLSNGDELHYTDMRQFGTMALMETDRLDTLSGLKDLGVEPLSEEFSRDYLKKQIKRRRIKIKPLLLDQTFIAGLGNIYADEALHRARINPEKTAANLTAREIALLYRAIREVLEEGIANRGTTFRDYVDGMGQAGSNKEALRVYDREGKPCLNCGKPIARIRLGGRSSYYCPKCQK
ncbi:MAG: formamidopyrimidine-DNA glycosylase [Peptococcaceae bacterium BICA1-7]|nr:MAG: formamidopyrimidine-DNA glycosylase [Peptococcaceae bacterium BICA1-7]HBV97282.1 bifunctional DNA-formamidopyrimidine glycosylase/DNA-(apurinic or apyrimidinic site) lyase [Desulfotomaculum sp.]